MAVPPVRSNNHVVLFQSPPHADGYRFLSYGGMHGPKHFSLTEEFIDLFLEMPDRH
jgi:hypothetical protein